MLSLNRKANLVGWFVRPEELWEESLLQAFQETKNTCALAAITKSEQKQKQDIKTDTQ